MTPRMAALALAIFMLPAPSLAFMEIERDGASAELKLFTRFSAMRGENPDSPMTSLIGKTFSASDTSFRLIAEGKAEGFMSAEFHAQESWIAGSALSQAATSSTGYVERSPAFAVTQRDDGSTLALFDVDRLSLRIDFDRVDITVGRQPVNLSALYFFTPNDVFAPFSASVFYRVYKPGVDAARVEARISELAQFTFLHALGYKTDAGSKTGWSQAVDDVRSSSIGKISATINEVGVTFLGGMAHGDEIVGGALQGEIAGKVGVRAEGNHVDPKSGDPYWTVAVEADRRFENSLNLRVAYLYNGKGADTVSQYDFTAMYPARRYAAAGVGYEFSPLLVGEAVWLLNLDDWSSLSAFTLVYSTSDESELALTVSLPKGAGWTESAQSEYGAKPTTAVMELRAYF